ncbi:MAG: ribonuclease D [Microbacteriaceae bacterium]|nr:ribonuclease D [Microbacteriaceae bacterium]
MVTEGTASGGPFHTIATHHEYQLAVEKISSGEGPIAVDAERASGFRYSQRAYLIQMFREGSGTFLFDPIGLGGFDELNLAIQNVEWIFHAASQDLACLREVGLEPTKIFDTELGARLAGLPRVGLATVVEELLGIHLAKEHSAADWSTRPLPESWLEYAALDVELLVRLRSEIDSILHNQGKQSIAAEEFQATLERAPKPSMAEPWRRLSGVHTLKHPRSLAVARSLWVSRDEYAREIDTAPGRLLPDSSIVAVSKTLPESAKALASTKEFTGRASRSQLELWWNAIERGLTSTDLPEARAQGDGIPNPRTWPDKHPEADRRLRSAKSAFSKLSEELAIPVENLLTPELLRQIAWNNPQSSELLIEALKDGGARNWQIEFAVPTIENAFVEAVQSTQDSLESDS